ncbi:MAG: SDR family oxidoreductase [Nitrospirae bacterium]|nr:SDR family oxidoreductase [Nitrospirota bacterium]
MKVLVTGVNGFIGQYLSRILCEKGYSVKGTVRSHRRILSVLNTIDISIVDDIGTKTDWHKILIDIDVIVHLAARVHIMKEISNNPLMEYRQVNTLGTKHLAMQASNAGVKRMIYISTIKVNGERTNNKPFTEKDQPIPEDFYAISKLDAEKYLCNIAEKTNLEVVILRPPLVYGAGVKGNFYNLLKLIKKGIPLPLSNINNIRSLIYIENLIDAIITCIQHPSATNKIFLVSDYENLSTSEIIKLLSMAFNKSNRLFHVPAKLLYIAGIITGQSNTIKRLTDSLSIDSSKIRNELGWIPPFTVNQGFKDTVEWFNLNEYNL